VFGKKPIIGACLAVAIAYGVYPYVTLFRLGQAVRDGDAVALQSMVNWDSVREGIKEDICDLVVDQPPTSQARGQLPPFGAGFLRGIATNVVDKRVTPEALVQAVRQSDPEQSAASAPVQVSWAFFAGPSTFMVDLSGQGQTDPIRLEMDLREGAWHVTRVWLPSGLLTQANART
jgi:Protein of unknown function (DUF2939)